MIEAPNLFRVLVERAARDQPHHHLDAFGTGLADIFEMRDLGVTDVVRKPLADEGRTLDRVIKKVMNLGNGKNVLGEIRSKTAASREHAEPEAATEWLTVTNAAKLLLKDVPSLDLAKARSRISTAAGRKEFTFNGTRKDRRIEPVSFDAWRLKQRDRDLDSEDDEDETT